MTELISGQINKGITFIRTAIILSFIALITIYLFHKGVTPSFSSDDYHHLSKNVFFNDFREAASVFFELDGREYRPLIRFSLWLNHKMAGGSAIPFHLTNIFVHFCNIVLIYYICLYLSATLLISFLASLIFAVHPIHSTNVNFIMGRTDLICAFFYLSSVLSFLIYNKNRKTVYYCASFFLFLCALLSKEMSVSLPLILSVLFFVSIPQKSSLRDKVIQVVQQTGAFWIITILYILWRLAGWSSSANDVSVYINYSFINIIRNYLMWAFGLVYPFDLYGVRMLFESHAALFVFLSISAGILVSCGFFILVGDAKKFIRSRLFILSILWFSITLMPIMGGLAHRWYLYLPSAMLSFLATAIWTGMKGNRRIFFYVFMGLFTVCCCSELQRQSSIWQKQSGASEKFFSEIEKNGIDRLDKFYFANVPFGYRSAFLFTFSSLEDAMLLRYGRKPEIGILSYLNMSDDGTVKTVQNKGRISFSLTPDKDCFLLFPPVQRIFSSTDYSFDVGACKVKLEKITSSGSIAAFAVLCPAEFKSPFYYFDGHEIRQIQ